MLQHNPHPHSIPCHAQAITLDGYQTREVPDDLAAGLPCLDCDCRLITDPKPAKAK